jgi:hypothetical protein
MGTWAEARTGAWRWRRALTLVAWAGGIAVSLLFGVRVYVRLRYYGDFAPLIFDDAFFFTRYAEIFRQSGVFGWNLGEGTVYGNTAQSYQLLVALLYRLLDGNAVLTLALCSMLGAVVYLVAIPAAYLAASTSRDPTVRTIVAALAVLFAAFDTQLDLLTATAMETSWAMGLMALALFATLRLAPGRRDPGRIGLVAVLILLVYATRPDAALVTVSAPLGLAVVTRDREQRRSGLIAGAAGLALIALFIGACWIYYGDPLPLAFAVKTPWLTPLADTDYEDYIGSPWSYARVAIVLRVPEAILFLASLLLLRRMKAALRAALLGALLFCLYHYVAVLPIMGAFGRYYAPAMAVFLVAALLAVEAIVARSGLVAGLARIDRRGAALLIALALLLADKVHPTLRNDYQRFADAVAQDDGRNTARGSLQHAAEAFYFFHRSATSLRRLGDALIANNCVAATTEDGLLSTYLGTLRLVDISGLHDRRDAQAGFSADRLLLERRPDVLVMPHPFYVQWNKDLVSHPALARDYAMDPPPDGPNGGAGTVAIGFRRDSACAQRVRAAIY